MTKFGELIGAKIPTLIDFHSDYEEEENIEYIIDN